MHVAIHQHLNLRQLASLGEGARGALFERGDFLRTGVTPQPRIKGVVYHIHVVGQRKMPRPVP